MKSKIISITPKNRKDWPFLPAKANFVVPCPNGDYYHTRTKSVAQDIAKLQAEFEANLQLIFAQE